MDDYKIPVPGKKVISTLIDLPLTISPIIAGLIYVLTFGRQSFLYDYLQNAGITIILQFPVLYWQRSLLPFLLFPEK